MIDRTHNQTEPLLWGSGKIGGFRNRRAVGGSHLPAASSEKISALRNLVRLKAPFVRINGWNRDGEEGGIWGIMPIYRLEASSSCSVVRPKMYFLGVVIAQQIIQPVWWRPKRFRND